jgi:RIO-like serine/threonine protein kinase
MVLIKENIQKKRQTWKLDHCYRKIWLFEDLYWQEEHVNLLNKVVPNYVKSFGNSQGTMWIDFEIIPGIPASNFSHTDEFIKTIYNFCIDNLKKTSPYAHGDWVLSNILIDGDNIKMCDWDNLNIYPEEDKIVKLKIDLRSAFGERFDEVIV